MSIRACRSVGGLPHDAFREAIPRAVPFVAGLLTIAAVGLAGLLCSGTRTGITAAFLLALSPWHIRYSVEARGYSVMLLLMLAAILAASAALRTSKWRWWTIFGLSQGGFLLAFPGSLHVAVMLNLAVIVALALARDGTGTGRYLVASCLGAMITLQLMAPSVPQILAFLARESGDWHPLDASWFRDFTSHLVAGMPTFRVDPDLQHGPSVALLADRIPFFRALILLGVPALGGAGLILMWFRQEKRARFFIVALLGGAALTCLQAVVTEGALMSWYLLYTAPLLALSMAALPDGIFLTRSALATVVATVLVFTYGALTWSSRNAIAFHDRQPIRQTVAMIRKAAPDAMTAVFGVSDRQVRSYDPRARVLETPDDLASCIATAHSKSQPLYIYYCGEKISAARRPGIMEALHNGARFEHVALLKGVEELFSYHLYRLRIDAREPE